MPALAAAMAALAVSLVARPAAAQTYPDAPQITDRHVPGQITVHLQDYAIVPKTSTSPGAQVARVNFLRSEPAGAPGAGSRFFTNDLNGKLYILDRDTRSFSTYVDFAATFGTSFDTSPGFAAGVVTFQFDPEYALAGSPHYGKFYTTHTAIDPDINPDQYRVGVLTRWQDINVDDAAFTGTHQEMLRVTYRSHIHPIGDLAFNPNAAPGHADYRMLYVSSGDGSAGENPDTRTQPRDLDNLLGKVLRIQPDIAGANPYSIPADNPWAATPGARGEILARGLRNPHRMHWDAPSNRLIVDDIGLHRWEEVNFVSAGADFAYSEREGNQTLTLPDIVGPLPQNDSTFGYTYPAAQYSHEDGDAISSGFVYRGALIPRLRGKYVFGDITTGRLFYCDYEELLAAGADGDPLTMASIHELNVLLEGQPVRIFDLVRDRFDLRNDSLDDNDPLPGSADVTNGADPYGVPYGGGRADIRLALGGDGELYLLSKSDGMIRALVPEPSSAALLAACAALALLRRRPGIRRLRA